MPKFTEINTTYEQINNCNSLQKSVPRYCWQKYFSETFTGKGKNPILYSETRWEYVFKKGENSNWYCTRGKWCCLEIVNRKNHNSQYPNSWYIRQYADKSVLDVWWGNDKFTRVIMQIVRELCSPKNFINEHQLHEILEIVIEMLNIAKN